MCHSLDVEERSKPKFKSVGLHLTFPQIDKVWDGSVHSRNMVEGARRSVCNLKCRLILTLAPLGGGGGQRAPLWFFANSS